MNLPVRYAPGCSSRISGLQPALQFSKAIPPFRYDRWLWIHNGAIAGFHRVKRDLILAIDPSLYPDIEGSTDSETLFFLALTFGLIDRPSGSCRACGWACGGRRSSSPALTIPIQMTVATSDGTSIWAFRYSSIGTLPFVVLLDQLAALRQLHPEVPVLQTLSDEARLVVSEPLGDLEGAWNEVPEATWGVVREGEDELRPFQPATVA